MLYFLAIVGGFVLFCFGFTLVWNLICRIDGVDSNNFIVKLTNNIWLTIRYCLESIVVLFKRVLYTFFDILETEPKRWQDYPATQKQKDFADKLGISYSSDITKGDLSYLITCKTGK